MAINQEKLWLQKVSKNIRVKEPKTLQMKKVKILQNSTGNTSKPSFVFPFSNNLA